jgi:hypothetical protein
MAAMACQRFARDDASTHQACQGIASPSRQVDLRELGGADGDVGRLEVTARPWHARGQGFKSPQLHHHDQGKRSARQPQPAAVPQQNPNLSAGKPATRRFETVGTYLAI